MWSNTLLPIQTHKPKKHTNTPKPISSCFYCFAPFVVSFGFSFFIRCTTQAPHLGYCLLLSSPPLFFFFHHHHRHHQQRHHSSILLFFIVLFVLFCFFVFFSRFCSPPGPPLVFQIQSPVFDAAFVRNVLVRGRCCCCRKRRRRRRRRKNAQVERFIFYGGMFFAQRCKERAALLPSLLLFFVFFFIFFGSRFSMQKESIVAVVSGV